MIQLCGALLHALFKICMNLVKLFEIRLTLERLVAQQAMSSEKRDGQGKVEYAQNSTYYPKNDALPYFDLSDDFIYIQISFEHTNHFTCLSRFDRDVLLVQILYFNNVIELVQMVGMDLARNRLTCKRTLHTFILFGVGAYFLNVGGIEDNRIPTIDFNFHHRNPAQFLFQNQIDLGEHRIR